jgi:hypothetical protein
VAIKVLRSDLVEEEDFLARFRREVRAVAALCHPNIIQVFDFDVQDWWAFLWPLEPLLVIGTVLFTLWLSGQGDRGRQTARHLDRSLKRPVMALIPVVILLRAIFG